MNCDETTYFGEAAGLMKGEDAKQVSKQSISDQFLKKMKTEGVDIYRFHSWSLLDQIEKNI